MKKTQDLIEELVIYAQNELFIDVDDIAFIRNGLFDLFKVYDLGERLEEYRELQEILDDLTDYAVENKIIDESDRLLFETKIMGILLPNPSQIIATFECIARMEGMEKALEYFYDISIKSNYIRMADISKNVSWNYTGERGDLKITINLSKPEKDPKEVLKASCAPQNSYPKCRLCAENVGFSGNANWPARQTLRTIPIFLGDEPWHFQYSPYSYFEEHLIALSNEHRPMVVDTNAIARMVDFVELFPMYFIGSNAALPIVGGSILAHDHYQGGAKVLPMMNAGAIDEYFHDSFCKSSLQILDWYNSVIRLQSNSAAEIMKLAGYVMECWASYSDDQIGLVAKGKKQHNAITPVVRLEDDIYVVDMILRNNRTDEEHPYGIYHPTEDLHNIKKESIGLIEVMGLFILPGRLYKEFETITSYLTGERELNFKELVDEKHPMSKHLAMIVQLSNDNGNSLSVGEASKVITEYINKSCEKILDCTAIFKNDIIGNKAFEYFVNTMGFCKEC